MLWIETKQTCRDGEFSFLSLAFSVLYIALPQRTEHCLRAGITDFDSIIYINRVRRKNCLNMQH